MFNMTLISSFTTQDGNLPVLNPRTKRGRKLAAKREMAGKVREDALVAMEHFKNMLELKWSSGIDMELSELRQFCRAVDTGGKLPNSGYNNNLPNGPDSHSDSSNESIGDGGFYSDLEEEHLQVPDLDAALFPPYPPNVIFHSRLPSRYLVNFIDHPTIPMDDVRASLPPLKTVVPLPSAKATLKHSLNTGLVGRVESRF